MQREYGQKINYKTWSWVISVLVMKLMLNYFSIQMLVWENLENGKKKFHLRSP